MEQQAYQAVVGKGPFWGELEVLGIRWARLHADDHCSGRSGCLGEIPVEAGGGDGGLTGDREHGGAGEEARQERVEREGPEGEHVQELDGQRQQLVHQECIDDLQATRWWASSKSAIQGALTQSSKYKQHIFCRDLNPGEWRVTLILGTQRRGPHLELRRHLPVALLETNSNLPDLVADPHP